MNKPKQLKPGDKIAIVSLSSGVLGEEFCKHELPIGIKRLEEYGLEVVFMPHACMGIEYLDKHPEARAQDLKDAFLDDSIAGIITAIGGNDTYRLLPYLMEDEEFAAAVCKHPKLFSGYSDTTINHLMFYKLGMTSYYGPCFLTDFAELADSMLPYSRDMFTHYLQNKSSICINSSDVWYEERADYSPAQIGINRVSHKESRGYELLQGATRFSGALLGGCLESIYEILTLDNKKKICEKYQLFPSRSEWSGKILFIETCEEKPIPSLFEKELLALKELGVFDEVNGVLVGKPQDETYYDEYKEIYKKIITNKNLPIVYNVNFGHAQPHCILPYGLNASVDMTQKTITITESLFD